VVKHQPGRAVCTVDPYFAKFLGVPRGQSENEFEWRQVVDAFGRVLGFGTDPLDPHVKACLESLLDVAETVWGFGPPFLHDDDLRPLIDDALPTTFDRSDFEALLGAISEPDLAAAVRQRSDEGLRRHLVEAVTDRLVDAFYWYFGMVRVSEPGP
jgi:hypothetical protein